MKSLTFDKRKLTALFLTSILVLLCYVQRIHAGSENENALGTCIVIQLKEGQKMDDLTLESKAFIPAYTQAQCQALVDESNQTTRFTQWTEVSSLDDLKEMTKSCLDYKCPKPCIDMKPCQCIPIGTQPVPARCM